MPCAPSCLHLACSLPAPRAPFLPARCPPCPPPAPSAPFQRPARTPALSQPVPCSLPVPPARPLPAPAPPVPCSPPRCPLSLPQQLRPRGELHPAARGKFLSEEIRIPLKVKNKKKNKKKGKKTNPANKPPTQSNYSDPTARGCRWRGGAAPQCHPVRCHTPSPPPPLLPTSHPDPFILLPICILLFSFHVNPRAEETFLHAQFLFLSVPSLRVTSAVSPRGERGPMGRTVGTGTGNGTELGQPPQPPGSSPANKGCPQSAGVPIALPVSPSPSRCPHHIGSLSVPLPASLLCRLCLGLQLGFRFACGVALQCRAVRCGAVHRCPGCSTVRCPRVQ